MNNNIPILGQAKPKAGVGMVGVLIRDLDDDGQYEPEQVVDAGNGQLVAIAGRKNLVTAEDLVEMMREMVREELAAVRQPQARIADYPPPTRLTKG